MNVVHMLQRLRTDIKKRLWNKSDASAERHVKNVKRDSQAQRRGQVLFYSSSKDWSLSVTSLTKSKIWFQSLNVHTEHKGFKLKRTGHYTSIQESNNVYYFQRTNTKANDEATVYVNDLNWFVTVQVLEDTSVVLSLGKLYEDLQYSQEQNQWSKIHLIQMVRNFNIKLRITCLSLIRSCHSDLQAHLRVHPHRWYRRNQYEMT